MSVRATLYANIKAKVAVPADIGGGYFKTDPAESAVFREFTDGTNDYQTDRAFIDTRTLAVSANEDLDLAGSLAGPITSSGVFAHVKALMVRASKTNTNNVIIKPGAANGFLGPFGAATHTIALQPGGLLMLVNPKTGWLVTAATGDIINIANSAGGTAVTYDIFVLGTST
jgi:hypothetical protein